MFNYFVAEYLKFKRTFYKKLLVLIPIFFVLLAYICIPKKIPLSQLFFEAMAINWWSILCLHFSFIVSCIMSDAIDKRDNKYDLIKSKGENIIYTWICKIIVITMFTFMLSCSYLLFLWLVNVISYGQVINILPEAVGILLSWLACIWEIPLALFLSYRFSWIVSLIFGFCGTITGVILAPNTYWYLIPWSYPTRLLCPIIKVYPNGLLITDKTDTLLNTSVKCIVLYYL